MLRFLSLLVVAFLLAKSQAYGQSVITLTQSFTNEAPGTANFNFATFDSSLGTLTSVQIGLTGVSISGNASSTNTSNINAPPGYNELISLQYQNTYQISNPAGDGVILEVDSNKSGFTTVAAGGSTPTYTLTGTQPAPDPLTAGVANISPYIGNGVTTVTLTLDSTNFLVTSASAGTNSVFYQSFGIALANGTAEIIYTYTPVPEPGQTAACMLGLALFVYAGRKYFPQQKLCRI